MTNEQFLRVDQLTQKIAALRAEAEEKLVEAESGDLTIAEALAWVRHANEQITDASRELKDIKKGANIGWAELAGAVATSLVGGAGFVRAWRGPSHKLTGVSS